MLLTDTAKTKETATLQKKLIEKKNLFGLGVTSLIAACGADGAGGGDTTTTMPPGGSSEEDGPDPLPFKAGALTAAQANGYTATIEKTSDLDSGSGGTDGELDVKITKGSEAPVFLNFPTGAADSDNRANIHKLTTTENQYDLVISSPSIDKNQTTGDPSATNPDYLKGRIFIYWDVAKVTSSSAPHLEIKGATKEDQIGAYAPDFLQIGGTDNNYDMIIRSYEVDKSSAGGDIDEGAIYILWDVEDYYQNANGAILNKRIDLGNLNLADGATSGSLAIHGGKQSDWIGIHAPEFLQLSGKEGEKKLDMVIRAFWVDKPSGVKNEGAIYILWDVADYYQDANGAILNKRIDLGKLNLADGATSGSLAIYGAEEGDYIGYSAPEFLPIGGKADNDDMVFAGRHFYNRQDTNTSRTGAIYILWDVEDYYGTQVKPNNKTINLGNLGGKDTTSLGEGATSGSLAIYGSLSGDQIGISAPDFLQIAGKDGDNKLDMVIRSHEVYSSVKNAGAIYILWDVEDYHSEEDEKKHKTITLNTTTLAEDDPVAPVAPNAHLGEGATSGSLAIYGKIKYDEIGTHAPEFVQIAGKDDNYDMIIRAHEVNKTAAGESEVDPKNEGAIYILWDVEDYYKDSGTIANKRIDLEVETGNPNYANSGLLTIYGAAANANLGSNVNNVLYDTDGELTNIDNDTVGSAAGTKDIAFRDGSHTYILFGDKIANDASSDSDDKVDSKTIDLAKVQAAFVGSEAAGFFGYDFVPGGLGSATKQDAKIPSSVGYRFSAADSAGLDTLLKVQGAYEGVSKLSDADADLGVWDIA